MEYHHWTDIYRVILFDVHHMFNYELLYFNYLQCCPKIVKFKTKLKYGLDDLDIYRSKKP